MVIIIAEREFIERITKEASRLTMRLDQTVIDLLKTIDRVKMLESSGELNLLFLKKNFEKYTDQIELIQIEIKRISHLYTLYGKEMQVSERVIWENYYKLEFKFQDTAKEFLSFMEEYKHFIPSNANKLKQRIREILSKKDLIVDGSFEEAALQEKYSVNGFKQDFSEWFEWEIKDNEIAV